MKIVPFKEFNIYSEYSAVDVERLLSIHCNLHPNIEQISRNKEFEGHISNGEFKIALPNFASSSGVPAISSLAVFSGNILQLEHCSCVKAYCRPQINPLIIYIAILVLLVINPIFSLISNGESEKWPLLFLGVAIVGVLSFAFYKEVKKLHSIICQLVEGKENI